MDTQNTISIDAWFPRNGAPHFHEHAERVVAINSTSTASEQRIREILTRALIVCTETAAENPQLQVLARDLFLPDEYAGLSHREKCLNGMVLAWLCRQGLIPLEKLPYASSPARYRIVPERIDLELLHSLTH